MLVLTSAECSVKLEMIYHSYDNGLLFLLKYLGIQWHRMLRAEIRCSDWNYGHDYITVTAGVAGFIPRPTTFLEKGVGRNSLILIGR